MGKTRVGADLSRLHISTFLLEHQRRQLNFLVLMAVDLFSQRDDFSLIWRMIHHSLPSLSALQWFSLPSPLFFFSHLRSLTTIYTISQDSFWSSESRRRLSDASQTPGAAYFYWKQLTENLHSIPEKWMRPIHRLCGTPASSPGSHYTLFFLSTFLCWFESSLKQGGLPRKVVDLFPPYFLLWVVCQDLAASSSFLSQARRLWWTSFVDLEGLHHYLSCITWGAISPLWPLSTRSKTCLVQLQLLPTDWRHVLNNFKKL